MTQENLRAGSSGYATGSICPRTGNYKSSNKFMDTIIMVCKGDAFPTGSDGAKTTWTALSSADSSKTSFESVKVSAGTVA